MIILISGRQGSGKTTLASILEVGLKNYGHEVKRISFAGPIYKMHHAVRDALAELDPDNSLKYDYSKKDGNLLQLLGTEWGRNIDNEIWVKLLISTINKNPNAIYIIDDCRFKNELSSIKNSFDKVMAVRLECDREIRKKRVSMWRENENHPSEIDLNDWANNTYFHHIFNTGLADGAAFIARTIITDLTIKYGL